MSLESSIAALATQGGLLLDLPQQFSTMASAKLAEHTAWWMSRAAAMEAVFYVDPVAGVDTAAGTLVAPLKTIQRAVDLVPVGGTGWINLTGPVTLNAHITIKNRWISISSSSSTRHAINFERYSGTINATIHRRCYSFRLRGTASICISGLTLNVPALDFPYTTYSSDGNDFLMGSDGVVWLGTHSITLYSCDIAIPIAPFGALISDQMPLQFSLWSCTATNQALNGKIIRGITATGGTATSTVPYITTNLTTV